MTHLLNKISSCIERNQKRSSESGEKNNEFETNIDELNKIKNELSKAIEKRPLNILSASDEEFYRDLIEEHCPKTKMEKILNILKWLAIVIIVLLVLFYIINRFSDDDGDNSNDDE